MITLRVTDIAKKRILNGKDFLEHDQYNNKRYLKFDSIMIQSCRNGFIVSFCDEHGAELIATDYRVDFNDTLSISVQGRVEIQVEHT